jgi:hypothetical protein
MYLELTFCTFEIDLHFIDIFLRVCGGVGKDGRVSHPLRHPPIFQRKQAQPWEMSPWGREKNEIKK